MRLLLPIIAFLLCLPAAVPAQQEKVGLDEVTRTLERPFRSETPASERIQDFQADFVQLSHLASLDREQHGQGRVEVRFDRSSASREAVTQFRWDYDQPTRQEIISDGQTLWVFLPENNQVIRSDIEASFKSQGDNPLSFLTGLGNLSRDFQIGWGSPEQDPEGNYLLRLQPQQASGMIKEMVVVVNREAVSDLVRNHRSGKIFPFLSTLVTDPNDNTTRIEFKNVRINRGLASGSFHFDIPAGVEVVRPSGQPAGF